MTTSSRKNIYVAEPTIEQAVKTGLGLLLHYWNTLDAPTAWIVCTQKADLKNNVGKALGPIASILEKHNKATVQDMQGRELQFFHKRNLPPTGAGAAVLALIPTKELLTAIDSLSGTPVLIVVPFTDEEAAPWRKARQPDVVGQRQPSTEASPALPELQKRALDGLLTQLNKSAPTISHPSDRDFAIQSFRALQRAETAYSTVDVRAYLVANGLNPQQADEVQAIAEDPQKFRLSTKKRITTDNMINNWKK